MAVAIELMGLRLRGHHGVGEGERRRGQTFVFDLRLHVAEPAEDAVEEAVDYRAVPGLVRDVSEAREYRLIEVLAAAVADAVCERFPAVERVEVRVRKPEVRLDPPVEGGPAVVVVRP